MLKTFTVVVLMEAGHAAETAERSAADIVIASHFLATRGRNLNSLQRPDIRASMPGARACQGRVAAAESRDMR
jgi:hypothetical protein